LLEQPEHLLADILELAIEAGVIREEGASPGHYAFTHALVHDALYDGLTKARRASLHRRAGEILERVDGGDIRGWYGELARHFRRSAVDDANRAVDFSVRAGQEASTLLGFAEARSHFEQALQMLCLVDPTDRARRHDILLALGRAQLSEYDFAGARRSYVEAARLAIGPSLAGDPPQTGDPNIAGDPNVAAEPGVAVDANAAVIGIMWTIEFGDVDPAVISLLEQAIAQVGPTQNPLAARLRASLARALPASDPRIPDLARAAEATAASLGDPETSAFVHAATLLATWTPHNTAERLAVADRLIELTRDLDWIELAIESRNWRAAAREELTDLAGTQTDLDEMSALADRAGQPFYTASVAMRRASRALAQGCYPEAARLANTMLATGGEVSRNFRGVYAIQMLTLRRDRGDLAGAADIVTAAIAAAPDVPAWRAARALVHVGLGRRDQAAAELAELTDNYCAALPGDWLWAGAIGHLAEVCTRLDDPDRAEILLELLRPYARRNLVVANGALSTGAAARNLGMLCTVLGDFDEAEHHLRVAVEINTQWAARPWLIRTEFAYADLLRRRGQAGDQRAADRLLTSARAQAATIGMAELPTTRMGPSQSSMR